MQLEQYQTNMKQFIIESLNQTNKIVVVGMATGTGKTITAYEAISELLKDPNNRVLVLAHNQLILRKNFIRQSHGITPFEFKSKNDLEEVLTQRLIVTIPSSIAKSLDSMGKFTHIFVDEAHERTGKAEYNRILIATGNPRQVFLTASHGGFNGSKYIKNTFSMYEGLKAGRISNLTSVGIQTPWNLTKDDYTSSREIKGTKIITRESVIEAVKDLIENYRSYFRLESFKDKITSKVQDIKEKFVSADFPKTIISCRDTKMCNIVYEYFNEIMPGAISLSHSLDPYDDEATLNTFDANDLKRVIVVVKRASLGFDSPRTQVVVDMTGSRNPDRIMQLMGRVTRIHPEGKEKVFFKIVPEIFKVEMKRIWGVLFALGHPMYYANYDSSNYKEVPLLVERTDSGKVPEVAGQRKVSVSDGTIEIKPLNTWMMNAAMCWDYIEKLEHNDADAVAAYTRMTIKDIQKIEDDIDAPWLNFTTAQEFAEWLAKDRFEIKNHKEWRKAPNSGYNKAVVLGLTKDVAKLMNWVLPETKSPEEWYDLLVNLTDVPKIGTKEYVGLKNFKKYTLYNKLLEENPVLRSIQSNKTLTK